MRSSNVTATLNTLVNNFVSELQDLILDSARDAVGQALGGSSGSRAARVRNGSARAVPSAAGLGLGKGQKRDPAVLAALVEKLHAYIKKNPGERIEQIAQGMDLSTRELNLPAKKLIAERRITTKGEKRATTYFPKG